jgi:hypothetical protein
MGLNDNEEFAYDMNIDFDDVERNKVLVQRLLEFSIFVLRR